MRIVEAPITLVDRGWDFVPKGLRRRIDPFRVTHGLALKAWRGRRRPTWLRPSFDDAKAMLAATDYLARREAREEVFLCVMFHTNEATAGASPYNATESDVERFLGELEQYLDALRARYDVEPIGLTEAASAACLA